MRGQVIFLLATLGLLLLAACAGGEPQIGLETTALDLGDVPNGVVVTRDVAVRNDGETTLFIEGISTSCGCTTATLTPMQIPPGKGGVLHVAYDSGAHGPDLTGSLVRQVFINSNDPTQPEATVELTVNVTPPEQVDEG